MFKKLKKAELGIGALIIFISMILIATIAAGVLISTSSSLKDKALSTSNIAKDQILTKLEILEISAEDGTTNNLRNFFILTKLGIGSEPINLEDLVITLSLYDSSSTIIYKDGLLTNTASGYYTSGSNGNFTVEYVKKGEKFIKGSLNTGDIVRLYLSAPRSIEENENLMLNFISSEGMPSKIEFTTPSVISNKREYIYP